MLRLAKPFFLPAHYALPAVVATQATLLVIGLTYLSFDVTIVDVAAALVGACSIECFVRYLQKRSLRPVTTWFSTAAAALGIALFLRATSPLYFFAAGVLAIGLKYVIRNRTTHLFNPSNIALLIIVFTCTSSATIEITQWGSQPVFYGIVAAVLLYVSAVARMIRISIGFLIAYTVLFIGGFHFRLIEIGHHVGLLGPSFMLFISFMLTDPKTAPRTRAEQWIQGPSVAALYFILELVGVRYALFVASFLNAALIWLVGHIREWVHSTNGVKRAYPRNAVVAFFAYVTLALLVIPPIMKAPDSHISTMSWKYLLFGVEFSGAQACSATPVLQKTFLGVEQSARTEGASWGDSNGDGVDELFVANIDTPSVLYQFSSKEGVFQDHTALSNLPPMRASSAFFADIDNDGDQDLVVAALRENNNSNPGGEVRTFFNHGTGFFVESKDALVHTYPAMQASLSLADFDSDGFLDVVLASFGSVQRWYPDDSIAFAKVFFDPFRRNRKFFSCNQRTLDPLKKDILAFAPQDQHASLESLMSDDFCLLLGYSFSPFMEDVTERTLTQVLQNRTFVYVQIMRPGELHLFKGHGNRFTRVPEFTTYTQELITTGPGIWARDPEPAYVVSGQYFQPISFDYDHDGRMDIFVTTDYGSNVLLRNTGSLTFVDVTEVEGLAVTGTGMGVAVDDVNRDKRIDLMVSNVWKDYLFTGNDTHTPNVPRFSFESEETFGRYGVGWGIGFFDYDSDGWLDLLTVNGDLVGNTLKMEQSSIVRPAFMVDTLHRNNQGVLQDVTGKDICTDISNGRALAFSDVEQDGDTDIFIGSYANLRSLEPSPQGSASLYKNTTMDVASTSPNFLSVSLRGTKSNRDGVGAQVSVLDSQGHTQIKQIFIGDSYYSQHSKTLLFGLGSATVKEVVVTWPSGQITRTNNVGTSTKILIVE